MIRLDRLDLKILTCLETQGRITNADLSSTIGLSPSPCLQRVRRLEKAGLIKEYRAEIDWKKVYSYITLIAEVTLKKHSDRANTLFLRTISNVPGVTRCFALCGGLDFMVHFNCKDLETYQITIDQLLDKYRFIDKVVSYVVMQEVEINNSLPDASVAARRDICNRSDLAVA